MQWNLTNKFAHFRRFNNATADRGGFRSAKIPFSADMLVKMGLFVALAALLLARVTTAGKAHSFQHYHGPVKGHHEKITWVDKHGHHHHDYVAEPHYKFSYGVDDKHTKDSHGHSEHHDGKHVNGVYKINEPGGNVRTVKYWSDEHGFHAHVHNSGPTHHHYGR